MKVWWIMVGLVVLMSISAGCTTPAPAQEMDSDAPAGAIEGPSPDVPADALALVDRARADLMQKTGTKTEDVTLLSVEKINFADASLGVPEPDKMYAQVVTPGYVIRFQVGDTVYTYHGSGERVVLVPETQSMNKPSLAKNVPSANELERSLGSRMLNDPSALCEWEVWGSGDQVLYLWAVCESASGSAVSAPAVVYLDERGRVASANMPGDGTYYASDVRRLFPPAVQARIHAHQYDARAAMERISKRRLASK